VSVHLALQSQQIGLGIFTRDFGNPCLIVGLPYSKGLLSRIDFQAKYIRGLPIGCTAATSLPSMMRRGTSACP